MIEPVTTSRRRLARYIPAGLSREILARAKPLLKGILFAFAWPLSFLLQFLPYRFFGHPQANFWAFIGHLALEPDCFIKQGILNLRPSFRGIMLAPSADVANSCLLDYWGKYFHIIRSPLACKLLRPFAAQSRLNWTTVYAGGINATPDWPGIQAKWGDRPPLLQLSESHRKDGREKLREWGMPEGAWYVCVHCREGGYDRHNPMHSMRNAKIDDLLPPMREIVARGGYCIRMGDPTMKPLMPEPGIIDYAHHQERCDWLDVFLSADCRFFVGSASGLYVVASVFGVPAVIVNQALPVLCHGYGFRDIYTPKLLWSHNLERFLTFPEVASSAFGKVRFSHCFDNTGIEVRDNTAEEISDAVIEMFEDIEGRSDETEEDRCLQAAMQLLFQPGHYSYGAVSRVSRHFLRRHRSLLNAENPTVLRQGAQPECGTSHCSCFAS